MYIDNFGFAIGHKTPSKDAESINVIPFGTKLLCKPEGPTETILSMTGQWHYCNEIKGYVFGPLLSPTRRDKSKLRMRLKEGFVADAHGHSGTFFQLLAKNKTEFKGMQYLGTAGDQQEIPVKGKGTYLVQDNYLVITRLDEKAYTYRLRWLSKINAFVNEDDFERVMRILPNLKYEDKQYQINRELCVIEEVEYFEDKRNRVYLGDGIPLYCVQ